MDASILNGRHKLDTQTKKVAFDDAIPAAGPELFIVRLKANEQRQFCILGTRIRGLWVHWNPASGHSEPHYDGECEACEKQMPKRWKGFLHCYEETEKGGEVFLELTPTSANQIVRDVPNPDDLRGNVIMVRRGAKANSRLNIHVQIYNRPADKLPKERDPRKSILKLWGCLTPKIDEWLTRGGFAEPGGEEE